jgi:FtsP/CotA-like multicopper oxidase with cupredoxin domain
VKVLIVNEPDSDHPMQHPVHFHGQRFLVLSRDGVRNPNLAWKDTEMVTAGQTTDLLVEMSNPGIWMSHCHIAEHLEGGMMFSFDVEDDG